MLPESTEHLPTCEPLDDNPLAKWRRGQEPILEYYVEGGEPTLAVCGWTFCGITERSEALWQLRKAKREWAAR